MVRLALVATLAMLTGCTTRPVGYDLRTGTVRPSDPGDGPAVVVFERTLRSADRLALIERGLTPIAPLRGAWIVRGDTARARDLDGVAWVGALPGPLRVDPALRDGGATIGVAELVPGADTDRLVERLHAEGLPVDGVGRRIVSALTEDQVAPWIEALADDPEVLWLGRRHRRVMLDQVGASISQVGPAGAGATPMFDVGLDGRGQIAAILDTGIDIDHCLFSDAAVPPAINTTGTDVASKARKVVAVDFLWSEDDPADPLDWDGDSHGSHIAGILAGDELADGVLGLGDGIALGAKLVVQDAGSAADNCADLPGLGCDVTDLVPVFEQAYAQGARVHSNSWGDRENAPVTSTYSDGSLDADQESWDRPDYLLVFASGEGGGGNEVWSPGNAKNTLSVGATQTGSGAGQMASFSSGGPTFDGRIKPDLVFPGAASSALTDGDINTANCGLTAMSGTSMAAPGAAGLALIVRQYFEDGWYPSAAPVPTDALAPTSSLVKAMLIASAEPVEGEQAYTGWGRPQLDRVLPIDPKGLRKLIVFDESDTRAFEGSDEPSFRTGFRVTDSTESVRITLVWRDPPGTLLAEEQLVNDLDLTMRASGAEWHGNMVGDFWSSLGGGPDRKNNVEVVRLEHPATIDYEIEISAHSIGLGPQPFALVISGAVEPAPVEPVETGGSGGGPVVTGSTGETGVLGDTGDSDIPPDGGQGDAARECNCDGTGSAAGWSALVLALALGRRRRG